MQLHWKTSAGLRLVSFRLYTSPFGWCFALFPFTAVNQSWDSRWLSAVSFPKTSADLTVVLKTPTQPVSPYCQVKSLVNLLYDKSTGPTIVFHQLTQEDVSFNSARGSQQDKGPCFLVTTCSAFSQPQTSQSTKQPAVSTGQQLPPEPLHSWCISLRYTPLMFPLASQRANSSKFQRTVLQVPFRYHNNFSVILEITALSRLWSQTWEWGEG